VIVTVTNSKNGGIHALQDYLPRRHRMIIILSAILPGSPAAFAVALTLLVRPAVMIMPSHWTPASLSVAIETQPSWWTACWIFQRAAPGQMQSCAR